jgi:hydrogenase nickel incorporation protein HypA/HybF
MHEMSIVMSVLESARAQEHGPRVTKIGLRIGEWSGVDLESIRFCFDSLVAGENDPPILEIESVPRKNRCGECGCLFEVKDFEIACPQCGDSPTTPVSGDELDIAFFELEEVGV